MASPPTTFSSLISLTQTTSHTYSLHLSDTFCIGTVPNGGYITTAFLIAARTHVTLTHPTLSTTHPINLHLEFLRRTASGPATFHVKDIKLGRRISNLHIALVQHIDPSDPSTKTQVEVEGYITLTDLEAESGLSHNTDYKLLPPPVPASLPALSSNTDENYILRRPDPYGSFRRAALHCEMYLVRPERRRNDTSLAIADQWVRFRPLATATNNNSSSDSSTATITKDLKAGTLQHTPGRWTNDALGYIVDIFPQLNERYLNPTIEDAVLTSPDIISDADIRDLVSGTKPSSSSSTSTTTTPPRTFWYPTLLLNLDVKKLLPPAGVEWLFVRVQAKSIRNGRFDLNVEVWDEAGELVALSTHASLILGAERNMTRTKKPEGKESKI